MKTFFKKFKLNYISLILLPFILTFIIESITRGNLSAGLSFISNNFAKFIYNSFVISVTLTPVILVKKKLFLSTLISSIWIILSIADNLVIKFRGMPLTGSDISMIKSGLTLVNQYLTSKQIILILLCILMLLVSLIILFIKSPKSKVTYKISLPIALIFILSFPLITNFAISRRIVSRNFWDITNAYSEYGFPYSFFNSVANSGVKKPLGYSKASTLSLKETLGQPAVEAFNLEVQTPNIIAVQLESFFDPTLLTELEFNTDPIPNFRLLSSNFSSGYLTVPSLGGGTSNTEFEVITGLSSSFFAAGEFPFNTIVSKKPVYSFANILKELGYTTHGLHDHDGTFYNRYKAYSNLGFDTFTSLEYMPPTDRTPVGWSKDMCLVPEIKTALTSSSSSDFVYAVSVQGHGGYPSEEIENKIIEIDSPFTSEIELSWEYYLHQVYEMDQFVGELINMVNELNEPTIIVFFGDHLPALGISEADLINGDLYTTSYVIWDNIGLDIVNEDLTAYQLLSSVLEQANLNYGIVSNFHLTHIGTDDYLSNLHLLQYDLLYGKNYIDDSTTASELSTMTLGINPIVIHEITYADGRATITGNNFTTFSRIIVNGTQVETTYFDSNTLSFDSTLVKDGDEVCIGQVSYSDVILSTTSIVIINKRLS